MRLVERAEAAGDGASVGDELYRRLRSDIVLARLAPGQRLRLEALREAYGASVTTLREMLSRLVAERLVVAEGRRGFEVAPVSLADLRDLGALRLLLETHAMAQSFAAGDMEWEGEVVAAHHKLAATEQLMMTAGTIQPSLWKKYDGEFHRALIARCGAPALMDTHAAVFDRYFRYQMIVFQFRGDEPAQQHRGLLDCALARDAAGAAALLERHVTRCIEHAAASGRLR